ncbi:tripartite motif-containing protein 75-like [Lithobates pipiens]
MASVDLKEELECSICLSIYTDPVTLICGHNFCQDCIGRVLDSQERSGGYFCPDCREEFQERPSLRRNITLRNIVENFQSTQPDQASSGVFCTYCIHTPVPAVKSCLMCEASLCVNHLRVHSKSPEHVLCDPTTSSENRKRSSSEHVLCDPTTSLENRKRSSSEHVLCDPTTSLENRKRSSSEHVLCDLTTSLETRKHLSSEHVLCGPTTSMENRKCSSSEHVLCDPTTSLENRKHLSSEHVLCGPTASLDNRKYSVHKNALHTGLSNAMTGVNVQKCADTYVYPHSSAKEMLPFIAKPSRKHPKPTPTIQHSHHQAGGPKIGAVQKTWGVPEFGDILLDVSTASNHLVIADDKKTVYRSPYKVFRELPGGFRCSQVISIQSFSSGRHYWEVDVGESPIWKIGMCYPSMDRRGYQSGLGYNNKSWCLARRRYNQCLLLHDCNQIPLPGDVYSNRVRVELDYEAGLISFYDLCYPIRHLHTFTTTFTEPLHAGLRVGKDSYMIIAGREIQDEKSA